MAGEDMISKYLASRGAAPSADNANRVRQHYASNPDLLDRRAMGLPGGLDDNSSVLDAYLAKQVAESMPAAAAPVTAPASEVPAPSPRGARVKGPTEVGGTKGTTINGGMPLNKQTALDGGSNMPATRDTTAPTNAASAGGASGYETDPGLSATQPSGISDILKLILGIGSTAGAAAIAAGRGGSTAAPTRGAPLPGSTPQMSTPVPGYEIPAPYGTDVKTPASNVPVAGSTSVPGEQAAANDLNKQRIQAEIAAENDAMQRQMEQDARNRRVQSGANDTANAAKRLFRR